MAWIAGRQEPVHLACLSPSAVRARCEAIAHVRAATSSGSFFTSTPRTPRILSARELAIRRVRDPFESATSLRCLFLLFHGSGSSIVEITGRRADPP